MTSLTHVVHRLRRKARAERIATTLTQPVRHRDKGSSAEATAVQGMLPVSGSSQTGGSI